jgi:hypothetical protein
MEKGADANTKNNNEVYMYILIWIAALSEPMPPCLRAILLLHSKLCSMIPPATTVPHHHLSQPRAAI